MLDNSMFQPPAPVTTVDDLLRYPTDKLVALEQALPMQAVLRPVVIEALRRRGMMPGSRGAAGCYAASEVDNFAGNNDPACLWD